MFARATGEGGLRFGFGVGARVGKAWRRNKVRRWLREACREIGRRSRGGFDVVVVVRRNGDVEFGELVRELERLCVEAGILNGQ